MVVEVGVGCSLRRGIVAIVLVGVMREAEAIW